MKGAEAVAATEMPAADVASDAAAKEEEVDVAVKPLLRILRLLPLLLLLLLCW